MTSLPRLKKLAPLYLDMALNSRTFARSFPKRRSRHLLILIILHFILVYMQVGEFSGFDEIDLLKETEKAVGGTELYESESLYPS